MSLPLEKYLRLPKRLPLSVGFKRYMLHFVPNDYVVIPDSSTLTIANMSELTIIVMARSINNNEVQIFVSKNYEYFLQPRYTSNIWRIGIGNGSSWGNLYTGSTVTDGKWHHFALVWDGTNIKGYLDGVLNIPGGDDGITSTKDSGNSVVINGWNTSTIEGLEGDIAYIAIYNKALSEWEIRYNMLNYNNPTRDGLVLLLYDKIYGGTWYDESGNNNNGTIHDATKENLEMWELRAIMGL